MGTIKLPTYESHIPTQYPGAEPRPDLEGMARLGQAQNNFFSTLFGAGQFAVKLYAQAQAEKSANTRNQAATAYLNREGDNVRLIEQMPVSPDDPLLKDANEDQKNLPNLYLLDKQNQTARDEIVATITDDADKEWFVQWQAQHDASTRKTVGEWDIGIQKGLFMDRTSKQLQDMIALGNVAGADQIIDNIPSGYVNREEKKELVRKDIAKGMLLKAAVSMGDAGAAFLADPSKLRYPGLNGEARDMPAADVEDMKKTYASGLAWQNSQDEIYNDSADKKLSDALLARRLGKQSDWSLNMVGAVGFRGKTGSSHQQYWMNQWYDYIRSTKPGGDKDPWANSDPRVVQALIDMRNDPNVPDSTYKATIRDLTSGGYKGLGRADSEQYYSKPRPETPISKAVSEVFSKATQGAYPLLTPQQAVDVRLALDKEIETAREAKKPYSDADIQKRVEALMYSYQMANIGARMEKSVSAANHPTQAEKDQYKIWQEAMKDAKQYQGIQKKGTALGIGGWEPNLENVEAMQALIDTGKTFGMVGNPLMQPHLDALRNEYGKMFQTWTGKAPEASITLAAPKYGGRAVYGTRTLQGDRLFTVQINPKTNDEEWYLFDPKSDAMTLVDDKMKVALFGGKK